jgi:hypothetical protein
VRKEGEERSTEKRKVRNEGRGERKVRKEERIEGR